MTHQFPNKVDTLYINANLATMVPGLGPYGRVHHAALAVTGDRICWIGEVRHLPSDYKRRVRRVQDLDGRWMTPGLVDCHTHIIWGGNRAREFELRLQGVSYEEIARQGGGIRSTVAATRGADGEALYRSAANRIASLMAEGVTTLEIKSGYGLDLDTEIRILKVARRLGGALPLDIRSTFLGAHAVPTEFENNGDGYIDFLCSQVLPRVVAERLAESVDVFCESIGFTRSQTERIFKAAAAFGLSVKLHAEQLSDQDGAALAAQFGALSADHLEYLSEKGARAMAAAGTVAVLLPGAFYCLRETRLPPLERLRELNIPVAIATDCNPGTSPVGSILTVMNFACTLFRMTSEEALAAVTRNGARALGLHAVKGTLEPGKQADLVIWDISEPAELTYGIGFNPCLAVIYRGETVLTRTGTGISSSFSATSALAAGGDA